MNDDGVYELRPIANTQQRTIFDADFQQNYKGEDNENNIIEGDGQYIEGSATPLLPGPNEEGDPENVEPEREPGEDLEDITDELLGGDDYKYDDPNKEQDDEGSEE